MRRVRGAFRFGPLATSLGLAAIVIAAYLLGAISHSRNYFPMAQFRTVKDKILGREEVAGLLGRYDDYGRLMYFPGKQETPCPEPDASVAVLLTMGQSNSANHGEKLYHTRHPGRVVNYFEGECYDASSPLLGATGERGEFLTYLADMLVDSGRFSAVVLVPSSVGGTPVSRWQRDGDLNELVLKVVGQLRQRYRVTHILFHQGEADFRNFTSAKVYASSFNSLKESLRDVGIDAPFFISISTKCGRDAHWIPDNPTAFGQQMAVAGDSRVFLGANTDLLLASEDRAKDACHLSESGQVKTAQSFAQAIEAFEAEAEGHGDPAVPILDSSTASEGSNFF